MIRLFLLLIITIFPICATELIFGTGATDGFSAVYTKGIQLSQTNSSEYLAELSRLSQTETELFLDFENQKAVGLKDKNGKYKINYSGYTVIKKKSKLGNRYASFSARNSRIVVETNSSQLLGTSSINRSFYVSFFAMPGSLEQQSTLFEKYYITGGKKYGFECKIEDNKLVFYIYNMFRKSNGKSVSFVLKSDNILKSGKWTHVAISFDIDQYRVALFENGDRKSIVDASELSNSDVVSVGFHPNDTSPLFIGRKFYGKLDNFFIGHGLPDFDFLNSPYKKIEYDPNNKIASQFYGEIFSEVHSTKFSNSFLIDISYLIDKPQGTHYEVLYRYSDSIFDKKSEFPIWRNLKGFHLQEKERFKYFQWKVVLRSDFSGKYTPVFKQLKLRYIESKPPDPPVAIRIEPNPKTELGICLLWNSNHEDDVKEEGGYIIHYGISPDRMVASIHTDKNGNRITGLKTASALEKEYKSLHFCMDNSTISYNAESRKEKNLLSFQRGITYYFKVSAYNKFYNYKEKKGIDQKSKPSKSVLFTFPKYPIKPD